jgi:hypothetical protein
MGLESLGRKNIFKTVVDDQSIVDKEDIITTLPDPVVNIEGEEIAYIL